MFNPHTFKNTHIRNKLKLGKDLFTKFVRPKGLLFLFIALVGIGVLDPSATTFAEDDVLQSLGKILSLIIKMLTFVSIFIISVGGELMSTDIIIGDTASEGLKHVWVYTRNVTNIGFVLILIYLSLANLFSMGDSSGGWTIKEKLPKIILALIAINFSFLGFKVLIQAVDVGTVAILSIADTALEEKQAKTVEEILRTEVYEYTATDADKETSKAPFYEVFNKVMGCKAEGVTAAKNETECMFYIDPGAAAKNKTTKNILVAFSVHLMHLERLPGLAAGLGSLTQVLDSTLFSAIMGIMFVVALIAMFIVMIFRVAALWFFIAFSPMIVAAGILGIGGGGSEISTKIVTYLIIPLKIAAIFAVTFVMMGVLGDYEGVVATEWLKTGKSLGEVSLFTILWQIMTVAIFWRGAFWALDGTHADSIVKGIQSGAEQVGGFALKTATVDRPIFKAPGMDNAVSMTTVGRIPGMLESKRSSDLQDERTSMMGMLGASKESINATKELTTALNKHGNNKVTVPGEVADSIGSISSDSLKKLSDEDLTKFANKIATKDKEGTMKAALISYKNSTDPNALKTLKQAIKTNSNIATTDQVKFKDSSTSETKTEERSQKEFDFNGNNGTFQSKNTNNRNETKIDISTIKIDNTSELSSVVTTLNAATKGKLNDQEFRKDFVSDLGEIKEYLKSKDTNNKIDWDNLAVDEETGEFKVETKSKDTTAKTDAENVL